MQLRAVRSRPLQLLSVLVALLIAVPPSLLAAQTSGSSAAPTEAQLKLARSLFYDGLELIDKGEWAQAADRLQRVLEIRDSAVVSFHYANALHKLGRFVESRDRLQRVLNDPGASSEIRAAATELLPEVERSVGRITLRLVGEHEGVSILVAGRDTPLVALDVPVPVDPGEVKVVALRDGEEVASSTVRVGGDASLRVEVVLEIPARSQPPVAAAAPVLITPAVSSAPEPRPSSAFMTEPEMRDEDDDAGLLGQWWFWTAIGVVAAGTAVTVIALSSGGTEPADLSAVTGDFEPGLLEGRVQ